MTYNDVFELYKIKCRKYKSEQLTDKLRNILFLEAVKELQLMNYISEKGV